ncbi:MAG TPA: hypothetical protein ENJ95_09060 [Bacteroidetes bacterium]|nr:hypothetical protein [Bacteroidota bacterium]
MIKTEYHLWGKFFSPNLLKNISGIKMRLCNEPGDIAKTGRYKGVPRPYGACYICTPDAVKKDKIEWMAEFIFKYKNEFEKAGATEISFWIYYYGKQGNMEFTVVELNKISATQIPLCIDYIYEDKDK